MCAQGHSYESTAITQWLRDSNLSPLTGQELQHKQLTRSHALRNSIEEWQRDHFRLATRAQITIGRQLARGSFKTVHEGTLRGRPVAILKKRADHSCEEEAADMLEVLFAFTHLNGIDFEDVLEVAREKNMKPGLRVRLAVSDTAVTRPEGT